MGKKGVDPLKPGTPAWEKRQRVHAHNSLSGGVAISRANMQAIQRSPSTTANSKKLAREILEKLDFLQQHIKIRVD